MSLPSSPMRPRKPIVPPGFRAAPKPKQKPISAMTLRELHDQHDFNERLLASASVSTSALVERLSSEQAAIKARIFELEGVEQIRRGLDHTKINADEEMNVDENETLVIHAIDAKRRALSRYAPIRSNGANNVMSLDLQEAAELERRAHTQDMEKQQRYEEKKRRTGFPIKGEVLSQEEKQARILAFMSYKPTDSDLEDDDTEDEGDEDPSTWFEDDQDDGIKGQNIVEPDIDDISNVIRIDDSRIPYNSFYTSER